MNRTTYFNDIEHHLNTLSVRIKARGTLNLLELNIHAENFYLGLFNIMFGFKLENLNTHNQNNPAIDLIDNVNKIIIQVSSDKTIKKVQESLKHDSLSNYPAYNFKFIAIAGDASSLRKRVFKNPHVLSFSPEKDIYDTKSILSEIRDIDIKKLKRIHSFIKEELDETSKSKPAKTVVNITPSEHHISGEQAKQIHDLIDKIVSYEQKKSPEKEKSVFYSKQYKKLKNKYKVTSYLLIPREYGEDAISSLHKEIAILRPKIRKKAPELWRKEMYTSIYARWQNELGNRKEEIYTFVDEKLDKKISSLSDLSDSDLKSLYKLVFSIKK